VFAHPERIILSSRQARYKLAGAAIAPLGYSEIARNPADRRFFLLFHEIFWACNSTVTFRL